MKQKSPCEKKMADFLCKLSPRENSEKAHCPPSHGPDKYRGDSFIGGAWMNRIVLIAISMLLIVSSLWAETWIATAYCPCRACCGKTDGITASGIKAEQGTTCAVNWLPFGSVISVNGQSFIVEDRGARSDFGDSKHHNKRVDLFFNSHADARKFGRRLVDVEILSRGYDI